MSHKILKFAVLMLILNLLLVNQAGALHRIFWLESYHAENPWTKSMGMAIRETLSGHDVDLKIFHMDTKRNNTEDYIKRTAKRAVNEIHAYHPDVVIASDDNASKHVVMPFFKNTSLPIVFCGVNGSPDLYGYPYSNATGIIEVDPFPKLLYCLNHICPISKVGYLAEDGISARSNGYVYKMQTRFECVQYYAHTFDEWKDSFLRAQKEVDVLVIGNTSAIKSWDQDKAIEFVMKETRIPTGCILAFVARLTFIGCIKIPEEHGRYAAQTALEIINGTPPDSIGIATSKEAMLIVNLKIAEANGIKVPRSFIEKADRLIKN